MGSSTPDDGGRDRDEEPGDDREAPDGELWEDTDDALVLDENFIRDADVKEPAARTRMLRERWRDGGPEPQPWRADEPPAGWFFSKGRRRARKRRRRGRGR